MPERPSPTDPTGPRALLGAAHDALVRRCVLLSRALPTGVRASAAGLAGSPLSSRLLPTTALALLASGGRVDDARELLPDLAQRAHRRTLLARLLNRRLVTAITALEQPRLTEVALQHLRVPPRHAAKLEGSVAVRRARVLFDQGDLDGAGKTVAPHADTHPVAGLLARRYAGERAGLGPLPALPERAPDAPEPLPGRVLHLVSNALPHTQAGYTVRTHRIVCAQQAAGLDPHVATFVGWPPEGGESEQQVDGITYHRLRPGGRLPEGLGPRVEAGVAAATELALRLRPSVLHAATDHRNGSVALAVGARLGIPVVYEVRGFLEETWLAKAGPRAEGSERHRLIVERETAVMRAADAVVTLAATMREEIVARGIDPDKVVLAPNAVDPALLEARPDGAAFRRAHGIGEEEFVVGSVSSLVAYEGFDTLISAAARLRDAGVAVRVLLVGDGEARAGLREQADRLGLGSACLLPGRVPPDEALRAQAALDVFVAPRADQRVCRLVTPLKPVEAMALGTPVVASDIPALREVLAEGRAAVLVPPGDAGGLAEALLRLRGDPGLRARLVSAGRAEVTGRRTWPRVARTYRELYERLGAR
ncbi:glycosyltransferase family 4 protein [Marinactinospora endophytica]